MRRLAPRWCVILLGLAGMARAAGEGKVTLPVTLWENMLDRLEQAGEPTPSPVGVCPIHRTIEGVFSKGLFDGTLTASIEVLDDRGHIRVPVIDSGASLGEVLLNGKRTSLFMQGNMYTLGVDQPGRYDIRVGFFWGKEQDRFARRLRFRLPEAGSTEVEILVPEKEIKAELVNGALVSVIPTPRGTRLTGQLDASGLLDLGWSRKLTHQSTAAVRTEARLNTLFTIHEALVSGVAFFDVSVLEGETDRIDLRVPEGIEVVRVEGDAVLQWRTEAGKDHSAVTVLLRYLVEDQVRVAVHFQFPTPAGQAVTLRMPLPGKGTPVSGAIGIQGPAGLDVRVTGSQQAQVLTLRDLPRELTDLTSAPLLYGFSFSSPPVIELAVARHQEVELTSTLIDEVQASSVLIGDGSEITKLKLRIRNNTEQYLTMHLPAGAQLTHSLIDGHPVRPAVTEVNGREALLFPLRQSEKIGAGRARYHTVRPGETLSDISNLYYSDPSKWQSVLNNNRDRMTNEMDLTIGQTLRIPTREGVTVEESSFVIELAYKKKRPRTLGFLGSVVCTLPDIDVECMKVTWHLYFPRALMPLSFDANLTQYSAIRYDPFRRVRDFLKRVLWTPYAWAGGKYQSILKQRKVIYRTESQRRGRGEVVLAAFPLTGTRYRFKRVLMGTETPLIRVTYVDADLAPVVRWAGFLAALVLGLLLLGKHRSVRLAILSGAALVLFLFLAHYFLGLHRRLLWGVDLALLVAIFRLRAGPAWQGFKDILKSPWTVGRLLTLRNLAFLVGLVAIAWVVLTLPLLLSSISAVVLFFWWLRKSRQAGEEVAHA